MSGMQSHAWIDQGFTAETRPARNHVSIVIAMDPANHLNEITLTFAQHAWPSPAVGLQQFKDAIAALPVPADGEKT